MSTLSKPNCITWFSLNVGNSSEQKIMAYNSIGKLIKRKIINSGTVDIIVSQWAAGLYYISVGEETKKLLVW